MVRNFKRITSRGKIRPDLIMRAVRRVKIDHISIRQAAIEFHINYRTLSRYVKKIEDADINGNVSVPSIHVGYINNRQVFSTEKEDDLVSYVLQASNLFFDLNAKEIRRLAYEVGEDNKLTMPKSWITNKMAGAEWFKFFIQRHPTLCIRNSDGIFVENILNTLKAARKDEEKDLNIKQDEVEDEFVTPDKQQALEITIKEEVIEEVQKQLIVVETTDDFQEIDIKQEMIDGEMYFDPQLIIKDEIMDYEIVQIDEDEESQQ